MSEHRELYTPEPCRERAPLVHYFSFAAAMCVLLVAILAVIEAVHLGT